VIVEMTTKRYEFVLQASQAIAHHAETIGNERILMREDVRQRGGGFAAVPVVTGDTMRHGLREAAAYAFLDAAGLLDEPALTEAALRLLFAGGMVTGRGDASVISLDMYRELVELVPSLKLLGGCTNSRVIPGQLAVDTALLVCTETAHVLEMASPWVLDWTRERGEALESCRAHVAEEQRVRMDPVLVPEKRLLLAAGEQAAIARRLAAGETAHEAADAVGREHAKSTMLPRRYEVVKRGSLFAWGFSCRCYSALDVDTLHVMAASFLSNLHVGGKRATGHGAMTPVAWQGIEAPDPRRPSMAITAGFGPKVGDVFREHVIARRGRIRDLLATVDA
jgi:hypothetical protein